MIALVSLTRAKAHSEISFSEKDQEILRKIQGASAMVMAFIKLSSMPDSWIAENSSPLTYNVPADIQEATLMTFGDMWENREAGIVNPLSPAVIAILTPYRDPTLA